jgi:uroporphyrinogen-III synthase
VLPLSPNGLAILRRLARNPGEVVSRADLLDVLAGASVDPHTAEVAVARLREAMAPYVGPQPLVRTVVKRGYVLRTG